MEDDCIDNLLKPNQYKMLIGGKLKPWAQLILYRQKKYERVWQIPKTIKEWLKNLFPRVYT